MTRAEMIDEAVLQAPAWAHDHLIAALRDHSCGDDCERCRAAAEAIRAKYREIFAAPELSN